MGRRGPKPNPDSRSRHHRMETYGPYCECGNTKGLYAQACDRCTALDGRSSAVRDVIAVLRACDTVTVAQLAFETGASKDAVTHTLHRLRRVGRTRNLHADDRYARSEWILVR